MAVNPADDPVLMRFRTAVDRIYGKRIDRIVLFGSRARGDARPDSDYDIGLFLTELHSFDRESQALAEIETDILMATGAVFNALPLQAGAYTERTAWMGELRRDGVTL
ncbi:nucleotidyltransferase domain-containing protein [Methylobacterium sp. WL9]|uniref:Polymerase nucleotidyl transferase domain-containing protein n=2 Tax=Methylobacteriaceae TaxID=119045 RepID=A0ABQ4TLQ9_9HYPH|nr:nucleotidyltransferase domain-containing protein [Methylobacterium sp. WL9]GJE54758.1 hypothetical protein EKPJFOCH_1240 [Methylobacterium thuringiense]